MHSLERAKDGYYAKQRFADVFATLTRAPEHVADRLRAIPGVEQVETRVAAAVTLDVPGMAEIATGLLVSIPDHARPALNDLRLRRGRLPAPGAAGEVVASEPFAAADGLLTGGKVAAVVDGKRLLLQVVGTALSPEFTWTMPPGGMFPDDRRYGILWMRRSVLGPAVDMEGAFNDVSLGLSRGASLDDVLRRTDRALDRYGCLGAVPRKNQQSNFFVENELSQLRTLGMFVPAMFLLVAAFLLDIVVGRIVAGQREQIAALKALGYRDLEVGLHFGKLAGLVTLFGVLLGVGIAAWLGSAMTELYSDYYRFPDLAYRMTPSEALLGASISFAAAAAGTFGAIRRTVRLPPAEALRPEAPAVYRPTIVERMGLADLVPPAARIVLRELERRPGRAIMSVLGIALATGLVVVSSFMYDSIGHVMAVQFQLQQREDVQITLTDPRGEGVLTELEHLPGVAHAEPFRSVPVRFRCRQRHRDGAIVGVARGATLQTVRDEALRVVPIPREGLVMASKLAEVLGLRVGDSVRVEVRTGRRPVADVPVVRVVETYMGIGAWMDLEAVCALLGETPSVSGAWLAVDGDRIADLHRAVKATPQVAGLMERHRSVRTFQQIVHDNLGRSIMIQLAFSLVLALGVLYNAARITLAERARELASLRVLGFRRREVTAILLGEIGVLTLVSIPFGLVCGRAMATAMVEGMAGFDNEQVRFPLIIHPATYALATVTILGASFLSALAVWRRLDKIDLVEVLKTRE
jgi:putative ABC transport system permease protein